MPMLQHIRQPLGHGTACAMAAWQPSAKPQMLAHWHRAVSPVVQDGEIRKAFQRTLTKQGFKWKLGMKVRSGCQAHMHHTITPHRLIQDGQEITLIVSVQRAV